MGEFRADVAYPEKSNRLTVAFRGILAIPHAIVSYFWGIAAQVMAVPQWFIIVFTGKRNQALWDIQWAWLGYAGRVTAYQYLLYDEYPAFGTDVGRVPMVEELEYEEPASRLTNGLRFLWIIPAMLLMIVVSIAASVVLLIAWFAILFTGKFPRGMYDFTLKTVRYMLQLTSYSLLMSDTYPKWGTGVPAAWCRPPRLLEEPARRVVGEHLAARLARRAVVHRVARVLDGADRVAAHRARLARPTVHATRAVLGRAHVIARPLVLKTFGHGLADRRDDGGCVVCRELARHREGRQLGPVADLVGEAPADPGDSTLIAQEPVQAHRLLLEPRQQLVGFDGGGFRAEPVERP
jgi:hypothetical protein